jgi:hypothetical protein
MFFKLRSCAACLGDSTSDLAVAANAGSGLLLALAVILVGSVGLLLARWIARESGTILKARKPDYGSDGLSQNRCAPAAHRDVQKTPMEFSSN